MYFVWMPNDRDRWSGVPKVIDPSADEATLRQLVAGLTYDELVSAWYSSERRLTAETEVRRRGALVSLRALVLDEVERRSRRRYQRWLRLGGPSRTRSQRSRA